MAQATLLSNFGLIHRIILYLEVNPTIIGYDASDNQGDVYLEVGTGKVVFGNTTSPYLHTKSTSSVTDGYWHHVAICRSNGNLSIFIDGIKEVTTANTIDYQAPSGGTQYLTAFPDGPVGSNFNDIGDFAYTDVAKGGWRNAWNRGAVDQNYMTWESANNRWKISRQYPDMTNGPTGYTVHSILQQVQNILLPLKVRHGVAVDKLTFDMDT